MSIAITPCPPSSGNSGHLLPHVVTGESSGRGSPGVASAPVRQPVWV